MCDTREIYIRLKRTKPMIKKTFPYDKGDFYKGQK